MSAAPRRYAKKNDSETPPKRSKSAWGGAKGVEAIVGRFRGMLRVLGLSEIVFFASLPFFFRTPVAAQRACFFRKNGPSSFVGRYGPPVLALRVSVEAVRSQSKRGRGAAGAGEGELTRRRRRVQ